MTEAELIRSLNSLFGKDRSLLRQKLMEVRQDTSRWKKTGRSIHRKTGQPVNAYIGLFDDTFDLLDDPDGDMFWLGDCSYCYEILLNRGVQTGLDWDKRLALKCGGTAEFCVVWASLLLPCYALDTYCLKYNKHPGEYELFPHTVATKRQKVIVRQIREVMTEQGFERIAKRRAKQKVPRAITDCHEKGEATVFDCLFSDLYYYQERHVRFSDFDKLIKGAYRGTTVGWSERADRNGIIERSTWCEYPSKERVITKLDEKFRVIEIIIQRNSRNRIKSEITVDINKRKVTTRTF